MDFSQEEGGSESEQQQQQQLAAEAELERVFNKQDFRRMVVDVFIVDQHAADEKATFERLQARLVLNKQPLLLPKDLQLGPLDQAILR
ncbi:DNA mismatch repair PMS1 isoform X3 [Haematococcus lacustris]|uniref:DNA mismatch repair PMS1 isoform X3 n=1 Tax=Haematococcus lacustris TaxID=44745 RepID=A0A699YGR7_HAELA|nr:DNA mismatch repair PMS1 isoform X3 [Haematococcus lacustris]